MFAKQLPALLLVALCGLSSVIASGHEDTSSCNSVSQEKIGEKQVKMEDFDCSGQSGDSVGDSKMAKKKKPAKGGDDGVVNVCGAQCDTVCYDHNKPPFYYPSDCQVIYDALWYASQKNVQGQHFTIAKDHTVSMSYATCKGSFINEIDDHPLEYCRNDFGAVIKYIAGACPGGGKCVAKDKTWTIRAIGTTPIPGN
ncbi:hypothetical protein VNI00_012867 [Paramarasmius palmivorus]|uniref:Secreted protein n=1 Tax=Paramarasmius palmivorus TaxID=297713 RepID=A0AAW0BZZ0_9AGAR